MNCENPGYDYRNSQNSVSKDFVKQTKQLIIFLLSYVLIHLPYSFPSSVIIDSQ